MQIGTNETMTVRGTADFSSASTLTFKDDQIAKTKITQVNLEEHGIALSSMRVHDAPGTVLPNTPATDDLGYVRGAWGTDALTLQTIDQDSNGTPTASYAYFEYPITHEYVLGETIQFEISAGMITTIADTTATADLEIYVNNGDGAVGSDLCATAAQSINTLLTNTLDFTVTSGSLAKGDVLECRLAVTIEDGSTGAAVIGEIRTVKLKRDIRC